MNINQHEVYDDIKIIRCYPKFNYFSPQRDRRILRKKHLFGDLLAMIIIAIEFILSKMSIKVDLIGQQGCSRLNGLVDILDSFILMKS